MMPVTISTGHEHGPTDDLAQRSQCVGAHAVNDQAAVPKRSHQGGAQGMSAPAAFSRNDTPSVVLVQE